MLRADRASEALGMRVLADDPGHAVVEMPVRADMLNGFAITHGGLVFALADTAFAIACNEDDRVAVAAGADVTFLKSTTEGDGRPAHPLRALRAVRRDGARPDGRCRRGVPRAQHHDRPSRAARDATLIG
jgi:acyl-CoA thioesterase